MPFKFLKYLQPTHYFQLRREDGSYIFPVAESLPKEVVESLAIDNNFSSALATNYDLSWQAIMQGFINSDTPTYRQFDKVSVRDNYQFLRKYFSKAWVVYVLVIRILKFNNPIKEISGFLKTRNTHRIPIGKQHLKHKKYQSFTSNLAAEKPLVSVVIPTLNRYNYLRDILKDLERQTYKNFEVIVIDQSDSIDESFYNDFELKIELFKQKEKALWLARNNAVKQSKGEYIALSEDDVRVSDDWLFEHLKCVDFFNAEVSAGVFHPENQSIPDSRSFFAISSQFATGNALLHRDVFKKTGLFDRQFEKQRMGDGEFGLRVFLNGILSVSNPLAKCIDVKADTGGLRELGSWDAFRPTNFFAPRPIPSVVYFYRRYFGNKATKKALFRTVPISLFSYKLKRNKFYLLLASILSVILSPLICYQVYRSWKLASNKINQGPLIETLVE